MLNSIFFIEGIPGSGKTTRSKLLSDTLDLAPREMVYYHECEKNPLDLARYAVLNPYEYELLCQQIQLKCDKDISKRERIIKTFNDIVDYYDGLYYLPFYVLYHNPDTRSIAYALRSKDVYNGHYSFEAFRELHINRWKHFARSVFDDRCVYICDALLLQSPLFELMGYYDLPEEKITSYIGELLSCVLPLSPAIIYNHVSDVPTLLKQTCELRALDKEKWEKGFYKWMEAAPYFKKRDYHGFSGMCAFLQERQALEMRILDKMKVPTTYYERSV